MGTSNIFNGRKNSFNNNQNNENIKGNDDWKNVKSNFSKYINSDGKIGSIKGISRGYMKASGGSKAMKHQSSSGLNAGKRLVSIINSIQKNGFQATLNDIGIDYENKSLNEVFSLLINVISPSSNSKEDSVARIAVQDACAKIYDFIEKNNLPIDSIDKMPTELFNETVCEFLSSYIWTLMMKDLESRLEKYSNIPEKAVSIENDFKDLIHSTVEVELSKDKNIFGENATTSIESIYERCIKNLEGIE